MKKSFILALLVSCTTLSAPVMAEFIDRGGFQDPAEIVNTVAEVRNMQDHSYVVLTGKIEKRLGDEKYLFTDSSGSIRVEINDDNWNGLNITPTDTVEIAGKLDKSWFSDEIEVKRIRKVRK